MTDRPILFSAPMVRALLDGRKTQTRRLLNPQPDYVFRNVSDGFVDSMQRIIGESATGTEQRVTVSMHPIKPNDRLYVREHWKTVESYQDIAPRNMSGDEPILYLADGFEETWGWRIDGQYGRHRQAMHMPRWASRLTLNVTDVRVQRLQDISEADARAEGVGSIESHMPGTTSTTAIHGFRELWDSLNATRAPWDSNPWVVAYTFDVRRGNVDGVTS